MVKIFVSVVTRCWPTGLLKLMLNLASAKSEVSSYILCTLLYLLITESTRCQKVYVCVCSRAGEGGLVSSVLFLLSMTTILVM